VLSSGASAHAKTLIISHVAVSERHVRATRLPLGWPLLHHLLSLVLSSGAFAHVKALIISHVAVSERHVCAARLALGRSITCCHSCSAVALWLTSRRSSCHVVVSAGSEATAQMLNFLLSLVLSSGAVAHVKALIISHVAVSERHVRAARLPLGCFIICCHSCSAVARLLTSRRSSYHTWPSVGGTCVQRGYRSAASSSAVTRAQQWRVCSRQGAHHITRDRQWACVQREWHDVRQLRSSISRAIVRCITQG
jgi:hypothetical protein